MWNVSLGLKVASPVEANGKVDEVQVKVTHGSKRIEVTNIAACLIQDAKKTAVKACNAFLDDLSAKGHADLELDKSAEIAAEELEPSGHIKRFIRGLEEAIGLKERVIVVKKDVSGKEIARYDSFELGTITVRPNDAKSYYRKARTAADEFEKFRYFYLVAENISDKIRMLNGFGRLNERHLLKLGLQTCFKSNPSSLLNVARSVPEFITKSDPLDAVVELLYEGNRCQLNHAKASNKKKVPFNPQDIETVRNVLPLAEFVAKSLLDHEEGSLLAHP